MQVRRARVRWAGNDVEARASASALVGVLARADVAPPGLSPEAILCARSLADPRPRTLRLGSDRRAALAWERAVADALGELARRAARPRDGLVAPGADAILFEDRIELLVCLVRDVGAGRAAWRWWWRTLFPRGDAVSALRRELAECPELVPPLVDRLFEAGVPASRLGALGGDGEQRALAAAACRRLGAAALVEAIERPPEPAAAPAIARVAGARGVSDANLAVPAPWQAWVDPARLSGAGRGAQLLCGIACVLRRAPAIARTAAFARAVARWRDAVDGTGHSDATPSRARSPAPPPAPSSSAPPPAASSSGRARPPAPVSITTTGLTGGDARSAVAAPEPAGPAHAGDGPRAQGGAVGAGVGWSDPPAREGADGGAAGDALPSPLGPPSLTAPPPAPGAPTAPPVRPGPPSLTAAPHRQVATAVPAPPLADTPRAAAAAARVEDAPVTARARIETDLGGLFFLANVGLFLGLYGDFTTPLSTGIAMPFWDFIARLGRRLLDEAPADDDPVWALLERLRGPVPEPDPDVGPIDDAWLAALTDRVRARLGLALGLAAPSQLAPVLLARRATVTVTETHVRVRFALAEHPLAIRVAGLDRDPGWVPAAGRHIFFHFE